MAEIYDKSDMKSVLEALPQQIKDSYDMPNNITLKGNPENIIMCGMGGSSISEFIFAQYLKELDAKIPVFCVQDYDLPPYITRNSLVLIASYSGNTEESLSCYKQAIKNGHNIIVIASGGKLLEYANNAKIPVVVIPKGLQPRNAIAYMFFPLIRIFESSGIIPNQSDKVKRLVHALTQNKQAYMHSAQEIAEKCIGRIPIIYSSDNLYSIAYRWKSEFNENSKIPAFCNKFPELNHNEIIGFVNYAKLGIPMHIIMLHDIADHKRVQKRMSITKKLIREMTQDKIIFTDLAINGDDLLARLFSAIFVGDMTSYYLALQYQTDPTPVDVIEKFKKEMGPMI